MRRRLVLEGLALALRLADPLAVIGCEDVVVVRSGRQLELARYPAHLEAVWLWWLWLDSEALKDLLCRTVPWH